MTNKLWYFILVLALATSCSSSDDEVLVGNWEQMGSFGRSARSGASCFVIGNDVYVGSGYNGKATNSRLRDFWKYDVKEDTWDQAATLPAEAEARSHAASFVANGKGYVCGGVASVTAGDLKYLKDLWQYDPIAGSWTKKSDIISIAETDIDLTRAEAIGAGLNNMGYVGGGKNDEGDLKDFFRYDPTSDKWTKLPDMGGRKRRGGISFVANGIIYVCLGVNGDQYLSDLQAYDPVKGSWDKKADMRNAKTDESFDDDYTNMQRKGGVAFILNDRAYISVGAYGSANNSTWEYDYVADRWYKKTPFEGTGRYDAVGFSVYDAKLSKQRAFVAFGASSSSSVFDDVWEFRPNEEVNDNDNE